MRQADLNITGDIRMPEKLKLYRQIFGEAPWNEGYICNNCGKLYPLNFGGTCLCKAPELKLFYVPRDLKCAFDVQKKMEGYKELIAKVLEKPVGFIWGWQTSLESLNIDKFGLEKNKLESLTNNIKKIFPDFDFNSFYYFSEIGVMKDFRGKDVAGELYIEFIEQVNLSGNKYIVVRTTKKTDVPYKWFKDMGYKDVYSYEDEQDRVILVLNLENNETSS